jgi:hypothetical protein
MHRADAFTPLYSNTSTRTGSARACARDRQNRHREDRVILVFILILKSLLNANTNIYRYRVDLISGLRCDAPLQQGITKGVSVFWRCSECCLCWILTMNKLNSAFSTLKTATCIYRGAARPSTLARNRLEPVLIINIFKNYLYYFIILFFI